MNPPPTPIDLAQAADFPLGAAHVRPALRLFVANGAEETVEPRVMQVLVALARRAGEVVGRDELVALCWEGRVIGEDAIQRAIAKVRRLGEASHAFAVETISKVGYRLKANSAQAGALVSVVLAPRDAASPPAVAREPVLAVLPFDNLSGEAELQYFSDGVSEEILNAVARVAGVRVIGPTSSFCFRGALKSDAARQLNATHVLDGSVRRGARQVRISARLAEAASGEVLWSERYDRELTDALAVQDEIAAATAEALKAKLAPTAPKSPIDPQAYDLYLRAIAIRKSPDLPAQHKAITYLEAALAIEPGFARARAALAFTLCQRIVEATMDGARAEAFDEAVAAVRREAEQALKLDANDPEARLALISTAPPIHNWRAVEEAYEAARCAAPNDLSILFRYARWLMDVGRLREARALYARGYEIDPLSPVWMSLKVEELRMNGDLDGALTLSTRAYALAPRDVDVWTAHFAALVWSGRQAEAEGLADESRPLPHFLQNRPARRATIFLLIKWWRSRAAKDAEKARESLLAWASNWPFAVTTAFHALAMIGFEDEAFDFLDEAMSAYPAERVWSPWNSDSRLTGAFALFDVVTGERFKSPRLLPLCARLGLCAYWTETSHWPDFISDAPDRAEVEAQVRALAEDGDQD